MASFRALNDVILVKLDEDPRVSEGGIIMPDVAELRVHLTATVKVVGPGKWNKKRTARLPMPVEVGDKVVIIKWLREVQTNEAVQRCLGEQDLFPIRPDDILLIGDEDLIPGSIE